MHVSEVRAGRASHSLVFLLILLAACESERSSEPLPETLIPSEERVELAPEPPAVDAPQEAHWVLATTLREAAAQLGRILEVRVYWRENSLEKYGEPAVSRRVDLALYDSLSGNLLASASDTLLIGEFFEERMEDPLKEVRIEAGAVVVETGFWASMGSWSMSRDSFTFRPQNGCFRLIAYEGWVNDRASGAWSDTRFDLLTGEVLWTVGNREEEPLEGSDTEISATLTPLAPVCFGAMAGWTPPPPPVESPN
jgi:hypothetical protein